VTARDRFSKASQAARAAQVNKHLRRLIEDEQLRGNLTAAYGAARNAYGRMNNGKPATKALFEDRKLQSELASAANALRDAAQAFKQPAKRPRRGGLGRSLLLLIVAGALAIALSESLRSKVLDMLFGAEEEFDYSSTTAPPTEAPVEAPQEVASAS
jgi:hypothetical protein